MAQGERIKELRKALNLTLENLVNVLVLVKQRYQSWKREKGTSPIRCVNQSAGSLM